MSKGTKVSYMAFTVIFHEENIEVDVFSHQILSGCSLSHSEWFYFWNRGIFCTCYHFLDLILVILFSLFRHSSLHLRSAKCLTNSTTQEVQKCALLETWVHIFCFTLKCVWVLIEFNKADHRRAQFFKQSC